jgi:transposase-like protein
MEEKGRVLRSYGVFSSQITEWRRRFQVAIMTKKSNPTNHMQEENARLKAEVSLLRKENRKLAKNLHYHKVVLDMLKKFSGRSMASEGDKVDGMSRRSSK